jgi:RNA polymerase sigma-70 factor (ECF subfamily)
MQDKSDSREFCDAATHVQGLFVRHQLELRGMLLAILVDFAAVDDVLQETFLTVTRKADQFEKGTNFTAWAAAIARFHALDWRRRNGRMTTSLSEEVIERLCAAPKAQTSTERADRELSALEHCLKLLSNKMRQAVELRYREGHKPAEIARRLGWSPEAIYVALSRARAALRSCIDERMAAERGA